MNTATAWFLIATSSLAVPASASTARADCSRPPAISFRKGANFTTVSGGVVRAESICYTVEARAGQSLKVSVRSPDRNVVVTVYRPGYRVEASADGPDFKGAALPGAGDEDEAVRVDARLPVDGRYLLVLGTTRGGGGEYRMRIGVR